jgi:hypothetical protein
MAAKAKAEYVEEADVEVEPLAATTWYAPNQQCVHADTLGPALIHSTGGTAGIPGSWTPAGSMPPSSPADLQGGRPITVTATPGTGWTTGQYVQTGTVGAAGRACWTGTGWVGGAAP